MILKENSMQRTNEIQWVELLICICSTLVAACCWLLFTDPLAAQEPRYPLNSPNRAARQPADSFSGDPLSSPGFREGDSNARLASGVEGSFSVPVGDQDRALSAQQDFFELGRILATVGGEPIFAGDLIGDVNREIERVAPNAPDAVKEKNRPKLMQQLLPMAIEQKLVYVDMMRKLPDKSRIPKLREDIMDQYEKLELPKLIKDMGAESRDELDMKLRGLGTSLRANRDKWIDNQIVAIYVQQLVADKKTITRQEMLDEYNRHKEDYAVEAKVRWEELMISFDKAGGKDEAWKQIAELGNEVIFGASLSALAKEKSHGYGADEGGQHDWTTKGSLVHKEIDQLLFELPVNYLSDVIETKKGYHIIRVLERTDAGYVSFSEAQQEIKKQMESQHRKEKLGEYLKKLREEIPVEIYDEEVAKAYEQSKRR